jgi:hypothetical protein
MAGFTRVVRFYRIRYPAFSFARFDIPERTFEMRARSRSIAIYETTLLVANEFEVGRWRPWLREIARRAEVTVEEETIRA